MRTTFGGARPWVGILATSVVVAQCLIGAASPTGATPAAAPVPTKAAPKPSPEPTGEGRELVDRRTETSSTFTTGTPGVFHTVTYTRPVHVRQADGTWADIDQTLLPAGGRFHTAGTADGVTVGGTSADASLGQLKLDAGHSLSFAAASASGKPAAINGSKVRYAGLWPDVDLELNAANRGLKETIVLDSPAVPDVYTFPLRLTGLTASIDAAGNVIYRDEAGVERARTPHGIMEDSAVPRVGEGALSVGVSYSLVSQPGHGQALQVRLDRSWLNDPARVYPVRVDPTYWDSTTLQDDTYVMSGFSRDNASDAELKVGTYDGGSHVGISFMNFDVSGLSGMAIDSATFNAYETTSWSCDARGMGVYQVAQGWSGHGMTDYPGVALGQRVAWAPFAMGYSGCPAGWASFDVQGTVQNWTNGVWGMDGLAMKVDPGSEVDNFAWKKFDSWDACGGGGCIPHIDIYWHAPATVPSTPQSAGATANADGTATINWTPPASDGGAGIDQYAINYFTSNGVWTGQQVVACAGCTSAVVGGLTLGTAYYFGVYAHNSVGYGNPTLTNTITAATPPPPPPSASASENGTTATVKWTLVGSNNGAAIDQYAVNAYFTSNNAYAGRQNIVCSTCTTTSFASLAAGTGYYFQVYAHNAMGYGTPLRTNNIPTVPATPAAPTATAAYASAVVSWPAPAYDGGSAVSSYTVTAYDTAGGTSTQPCTGACVSARRLTYPNLVPGHSYSFTVVATNGLGTSGASPHSNTVTAQPTQTLAPTNVTATRGDRQATVGWTKPTLAVSGLTTYTVYTYRAADNVLLQTAQAGVATTACGTTAAPCAVVTGLRNGTAVYFTVTSTNTVVTSPQSAHSNTVTPAGVPFAPVIGTATAHDKSATVTWSPPPAQADGTPGNNGDPISGYTITVRRSSDNSVAQTVSAAASPATVGSLINGTAYYFTVHATNGVGSGGESANSNVVTPVGPPSAPTGVQATPHDRSVSLLWTASNANGASQVNYTINAYAVSNNALVSQTPTQTTTSGTVPNLTNGVGYYFTVTATSVGGTATSAHSNSVVPSAIPGTPSGVSAVLDNNGDVLVSWTQPAANGSMITSYTVRASNGSTISVPADTSGAAMTAAFPGLGTGQSYTFTVAAVNGDGTGPASAASGAVVPTSVPDAPTNATVSEASTQATVSWTASVTHGVAVSSYTVTAVSSVDGSSVSGSTSDGSTTSVHLTGLSSAPYAYSVVANSADGSSAPAPAAGQLSAPIEVALGDSYAAGQGNRPFLPGSNNDGCNRSRAAYSQRYISGTTAHPGALPFSSVFVACSGAGIPDVAGPNAQHTNDTNGGQITAVTSHPNANLITLTIGGNSVANVSNSSAAFANVISDCIIAWYDNLQGAGMAGAAGTSFTPIYCRTDFPNEAAAIANLHDPEVALYKQVAAAAPNAQIYVMGYPHIMTSQATCIGAPVEPSDIDWLGLQADNMDAMLATAVNDANATVGGRVHFIDPRSAFAGHEVCTSSPWLNGLQINITSHGPTYTTDSYSFHPNATGQETEADLLRAAAVLNGPTVTSISPTSGPASPSACAPTVTINGTNFDRSASVLFGAQPAQSVTYVSSTQLRAVPPKQAAGSVAVTVSTNLGLDWGSSSSTSASFTYQADTDPPTTASSVSPAPNAAGWNKANPTVSLTATDVTCPADIASITYSAAPSGSSGGQTISSTTVAGNHASVAITVEGTTVISYSAVDTSGNREATKQLTIRLDKTAPTNVTVAPSRAPDQNGWYNHSFGATWSGTDSLSGIASCTSTTYNTPDTGTGSLSGTCTDRAGNVSASVAFAFKYDATPPTSVQGTARPADHNGWYNHPVGITFNGVDATSGISSCTSSTYSGPDARSVTVPGSCTDVAGNSASATFGPFNYDATPAATTINGAAAQVITAGTALTGTASDNLSGVDVTTVTFTPPVGSAVVRQATCTSGCGTLSTTWSVDTSGLLGAYTVTAATTDLAGNPGTASNTVTLTVA